MESIFLALSLTLLSSIGLYSQVVTFVDENGIPVSGALCYTDDHEINEISDGNGQIILTGVSGNPLLQVQILGFKSEEIFYSRLTEGVDTIQLMVDDLQMEEIVIFGRRGVLQDDIPYQIKSITQKEISSTNAQTSADALAQHADIYLQKSQMGGGSPLVRGFEANRVLLVVDGVRMNNAIYRSGHVQNAITVDASVLDQLSVIFGPNSLAYGSDALGGVVSFDTKDPAIGRQASEVNFFSRYSSANQERAMHVDYSVGGQSFGSLTSVTAVDFDDLRSGSRRDSRFPDFGKRLLFQDRIGNEDVISRNPNPNIQIGTGYGQLDLLQKFSWVPSANHHLKANIQYSTSSDIPRYDNLSELKGDVLRWAEWDYGPQNRWLTSLEYQQYADNIFFDDLTIIGALQRIDEDRITRLWQSTQRIHQREDVHVSSLTVDASKEITELIRLTYGTDLQYNSISSTATNEDIITGDRESNVLTRYASGANRYTTLGGYITLSGQSRSRSLRYLAGLRYSGIRYELLYDRDDPVSWPDVFYEGIEGSTSALTWSVGANWDFAPKWKSRLMISTAFRAPNIDDLSKIRINANEISFPNVNLKPERSQNIELGLGHEFSDRWRVDGTVFYTKLDDAILRKDGLGPNGQSIWINEGEQLRIVQNQNAQQAEIYGYSLNAAVNLGQTAKLSGSINKTIGKELLDPGRSAPLAHIPPTYGHLSASMETNRWNLELIWRYNVAKDINDFGGSVDNPDLATPIGSLGWSTWNLYTNYQLSDHLQIDVGLENITDLHYRSFGSGVSAPGRNIIVAVRGSF
ncbi:MAG: TonB-dependent receptor [Bacteroidota bacterium]